mgnify:CR=1
MSLNQLALTISGLLFMAFLDGVVLYVYIVGFLWWFFEASLSGE